MANIYDDEALNDNIALQNLLAKQGTMNTMQPGMEEKQGVAPKQPEPKADLTSPLSAMAGIQAPVDPTNTPVKGTAMDTYNARLAAGDVSSDPTQRERERRDAEGATATSKVATPDSSQWNTDGYSKPGYVAANAYGAPGGYDGTKWNDPNHQTPKYVVGRILQEAAGGTGNLADPDKRAAAIAKVQEAYPGSVYNGKDKITFPDGGTVDVFGKSGAGLYEIAWMPETGPGGQPLPQGNGGPSGMPGVGDSSTERINSLVPTDVSTYQTLMKKLQGIIGPESTDRNALMALMNRDVQ
jgi:hypothetical protein